MAFPDDAPQIPAELPLIMPTLQCPHCSLKLAPHGEHSFYHGGSPDGASNACPNYDKRFILVTHDDGAQEVKSVIA